MNPLTELLAAQIAAEGPLPFEAFMEWALYHPVHGYYTTGSPFGPEGDFYTGPAVSGALGRALGRLLARRLAEEAVSSAVLVEAGAGDGRLAQAVAPAFGAECRLDAVHLVDLCTTRLPRSLPGVPAPLVCHETIDTLPESFDGAVYANELLDALPVARLEALERGRLQKCFVEFRDGRLAERWLPADEPAAADYARRYLPAGVRPFRFEYPLRLPDLLARLARKLGRGVAVFVDYGDRARALWTEQRTDGTLRAFRRHRVSGALLERPGEQDLTADVNFDFVADAARAAGFETGGYWTQGRFLMDNGLLDEFGTGTDPATLRRNMALKQLLLPGGMGEVFKVLALRRAADPARSSSSPSRTG